MSETAHPGNNAFDQPGPRLPRRRTGAWTPYLFISPFLIIFLAFTAYPLLQSIFLSFHYTFGPKSQAFVGLANYRFILNDPLFWRALQNTALFAALSLFFQLPCSLLLALLLNRKNLRGRALLRTIFFAPSLVGLVYAGTAFSLIFQKRTGLLDVSLHRLFNLSLDFPWLEEHAMAAMTIAAFWLYVGFNMIYFLAALQNVDPDLINAAQVDGAGPWSRFWNVTLPAIRPVGAFVVLLSLIGSFQLFELPFLLLSGPGPNDQGLTIVMYLYQIGFDTGDLGYASAIGWMLTVLLGFFAIAYRTLNRAEDT